MHIHGQFFKPLARDGRRVDEPFFRDTHEQAEAGTMGLLEVTSAR